MYRLEQSFRWRTYVEKRQDIADKLFQVTFNSLHEAVRTYPATTGDRLPDLDASVNETFLFHGARMPSAFCVGCLDVRGMSGGRRHFTLHFLRPCAQARNRKTSATSSAVAWMSTIRLMPACSVAAFTWLTQLAKATNTQPPCGRATTTPRISARRPDTCSAKRALADDRSCACLQGCTRCLWCELVWGRRSETSRAR